MNNQQDSSSKALVIIITAVVGTLGTIAVAYFAFRGNTEPKQLEIQATQEAESLGATQMANNIWITQTAQSIEATKFAESIKATQDSVALNSNSTTSQSVQATQTPLPTFTAVQATQTPLPTFTAIPPTDTPPSPVGQWVVIGNGNSGVLDIITINNGKISGTIYGNPIEGTWNEFTQVITFKRINSPDPNVYQMWYGEQVKQGSEYILTGYFEDVNGNNIGTYNWAAER